jgi:hypothetical protein
MRRYPAQLPNASQAITSKGVAAIIGACNTIAALLYYNEHLGLSFAAKPSAKGSYADQFVEKGVISPQ